MALLKYRSSKLHSTSPVLRIRLRGWLGFSNLRISGNNSTRKSSLQDQDEQISFFVKHFPVKNSVRLVDFQFLKVCGICQTVTTALQDPRSICDSFMYILNRFNIIHGSSVCFLTIGSLRKPRRQRQREPRETKGVMSRAMTVHVHYNSWHISLPSSAKQQCKMTNFCVV